MNLTFLPFIDIQIYFDIDSCFYLLNKLFYTIDIQVKNITFTIKNKVNFSLT